MILVVHNLTEDIEEENAHIPLQIFVIEEQFGEEAEVLTVDRVFGSVDFEHSDFELLIAIDFVSGRVIEWAVFAMPF